MEQTTEYKSVGAISLCFHLAIWLLLMLAIKINREYGGKGLSYWFCLFVFLLANSIVLAALVDLTNKHNWNQELLLEVVDGYLL